MNTLLSEITYPSSDGIHTVHAEIRKPKFREIRGIVQLSHGMIDYVGRYAELAEFLCEEGYAFAGNDHLGHGKTAKDPDELGFFAERGGVDFLLEDLHQMNKALRESYPGVPIVMLGHSMGSFLARLYVEKFPHTVAGAIFLGTGGPNAALPLGKFLCAVISGLRGKNYRSKFIANLAFAGYNSRFPKADGEFAWLTRDVARVNGRNDDPFTNYIFTVSGYRDLFRMVGGSNAKSWFENYPTSMPTLVISGDMDPVGGFGKGPAAVYKRLLVTGCTDLLLKTYPGARHELFNETNREEFFRDLVGWLSGVIR